MSCPARYSTCYFFENMIKQSLKDIKKALAKKPKTPAPRSHEISPYICSEVDKELEKNNIHPENVSLVVDDLKENIVASAQLIHITNVPDADYQGIITFNRKSFIAPSSKISRKNTRIIYTIAHEVAHIQYLHSIKQWYIQISKEMIKTCTNHVKKKSLK
jgi:hypothetical protein